MDIALIITICGIILTALIPLTGYLLKTRRELRNYYSVIWKKSSSLKSKDILGERPYNEYYYQRKEDINLRRQIERRHNVLLIGPPLMGKSRAVFEQLKSLQKKVDVLIPRCVSMPHFLFPKDFKFWKKKTIFIDDLQYYIEKQDNYHLLFRYAKENNINIIATCHSGQQFKKVKNKMIEQSIDIDNLFGENIIEYEKITPETGSEIAGKLGIKRDKVKFNGTIGSIFMRLSEMERRFDGCSNIEKTIMHAIRMMYITGLYSDNSIYSLEWIKITAGRHELAGKDFEWMGWLKSLEGKEFIKIMRRDKIRAEDAYLEYIVKSEIHQEDVDVFNEMIVIYKDVPDALLIIGKRAYDTGCVDINIAAYMKAVIKSCGLALGKLSEDDSASRFKAFDFTGSAYWTLSRVEDISANNIKALHYYSEALKLTDKNNSPYEYARLINKIASSYSSLATMQDIEKNCEEAIRLSKEALEFFTLSDYPVEYSQSSNNLGSIYQILAGFKEPAKNLKLAVGHLQNSLIVRTPEQYPREYGHSYNNLGNTFSMLSEIEDKEANLKLALECYNNCLRVSPKEKDHLGYGLALTNLGNTYSWLAEIRDTEKNCAKAIELLEKALEVRTPDRFPMQYATVQYSLGYAYLTLAGYNKDPEICFKAIDAFEESLSIKTINVHPEHFALNQAGLGDTYIILAQAEDKSKNYEKALAAYDEALKVCREGNFPGIYTLVNSRISKAKKIFF